LLYGFRSQRNFRIHVVTGAVVFAMGLWLQLPLGQLAVLVLTVTAVLVLELLNTATEAVVDLAIGRRFHPLARIAKDCAAAAVLVAALASLLIAGLLLLPPLLARLGV
jgi:diacylglycerol kinase (ATP)